MEINDAGLELIKKFEGCRLTAYKCPANVWTIGYGHTGKEVEEDLKITQAQADQYLRNDLSSFESDVEYLIKSIGLNLNENQFSALVCFAFNIGVGALRSSTLLKEIKKDPNNFKAIDFQFNRWVYANGEMLKGLVARRKAESALYQTPVVKYDFDDNDFF